MITEADLKDMEKRLIFILKQLKRIQDLVSDPWNTDDTICKQNMQKIKEIMNEKL